MLVGMRISLPINIKGWYQAWKWCKLFPALTATILPLMASSVHQPWLADYKLSFFCIWENSLSVGGRLHRRPSAHRNGDGSLMHSSIPCLSVEYRAIYFEALTLSALDAAYAYSNGWFVAAFNHSKLIRLERRAQKTSIWWIIPVMQLLMWYQRIAGT